MNQTKDAKIGSSLESQGYSRILDALTESIWIRDAQGKTFFANPNLCHLLGYTNEELIAMDPSDFWRPKDETEEKTIDHGSLANIKCEWVLISKGGEEIPVLLSTAPLSNGGTAGILTDLREIQVVREEARHFQELNQIKDEFIAMVGHELRTPMTGIRGYLSMILDGDAGPITEQTAKFLDKVIKESERLINMINDMLDVAKLESGKMEFHNERVEAIFLAREVFDSLTFLAAERTIDFQFLPMADLEKRYIMVDVPKIKQVLINLIGNALKFTPAHGTVTLRISRTDDSHILFEIIDTGIGIPEKFQKSIFEKFRQADNYLQKSVTGTGLGLFICRKILAHFDSDLDVSSEEWKGSNFFFSIKICE